jgi:hypothetical protein
MLSCFRENVSAVSRLRLRDRDHSFLFANMEHTKCENLEHPKRESKDHGLGNAHYKA